MVGSEEVKPAKTENSPPPGTGPAQSSVHVYPDWAAMQYHGPRVAMPPYYNPAVASGHPPPPYMWGSLPMLPPYGAPYAAIYAPGGVYAHRTVPLGTQVHDQAFSSPAVGDALVTTTPLSIDTPVKSSGKGDKGLMKKLKGFDGLAMSIGNGDDNAEKVEGIAENKFSQSAETDGSSDGSDCNTEEADHFKRKRSREGTPPNADDEQSDSKASLRIADKVLGIPVAPTLATVGHVMGTIAAPRATALELLNPAIDTKGNSTTVSPSNTVISSEPWIQNERELKREKRKQSNRESARRSRLRKQAEAEELAKKVDALNAENFVLRSEINTLLENSKKLRLENSTLLEKMKSLNSEREEESAVNWKLNPTDSTENLLSRVDNNGSVSRAPKEGTDMYEKGSKSGGSKLHQLLSANGRADVVAAS